MGEFLMPSLGADMDSGTIVEWRVAPGDAVHRGDIVAVVDTDKSDIEVEVFEEGVVEELLVEPGQTVAVGTPLARIGSARAAAKPEPAVTPKPAPKPKAPKRARAPRKAPPKVSPKAPAPVAAAVAAPVTAPVARVRSSPLARRRGAQQGVDLESLAGSGPGGAVVAADVPSTTGPVSRAERRPPAGGDRKAAMRRAIADLMSRSNREIPTYHLVTTIDLGPALAWLADQNLKRPVERRLLPAALLLKAAALAARQVPAMNGFWVDGFQPSPAVHLGVAISLRGGGLVAPAIHDADHLSLDDLMAALRDLVERARAGRLRTSEMSDPTITVTNLGDQGADEVLGVIYPPQVALVGFGRVVERPWAVDGLIGVRPTVRATLAADHRSSDGHEGSRFLTALDHLLHLPEELEL